MDIRSPVSDRLRQQQTQCLCNWSFSDKLGGNNRSFFCRRGELFNLFLDFADRTVVQVDSAQNIGGYPQGNFDIHFHLGLDILDCLNILRVGHHHNQRITDHI